MDRKRSKHWKCGHIPLETKVASTVSVDTHPPLTTTFLFIGFPYYPLSGIIDPRKHIEIIRIVTYINDRVASPKVGVF